MKYNKGKPELQNSGNKNHKHGTMNLKTGNKNYKTGNLSYKSGDKNYRTRYKNTDFNRFFTNAEENHCKYQVHSDIYFF